MFAAKRFNGLSFGALTVLLLASVQSILSENVDDVPTSFVGQSNKFAIKLYKQVSAENAGKNVVFSPFSIRACLSLLAMGAGGRTAEELFVGLHNETTAASTKSAVANTYRSLMNQLGNESTVNVANKIYVQQGYSIKDAFNTIATKSFQSEAESVDFAQNAAATKTINDWVESKTKNKIKNLIAPDSLDSSTRLVLINAVHFKGTWSYQFDPILTHPSPFWISETESREVPMMNSRIFLMYNNFEKHNFSALELKYSDSNITMLLLLPNERTGLAALEEKLPSLNLTELTTEMNEEEVEVFLPKFKIDFSRDLNDDLKALGMGKMFTDSAEFPDLLQQNKTLKVSKVVHKAFIEVNEDGIQAAAATGMGPSDLPGGNSTTPLKQFKANHPFIYALMYKKKSVFLLGKLVNPT